MSTYDHNACTEYNCVSRRDFLASSSVAAAAVASAPAWLPRIAYANDAFTSRDILVSIYLFGGIDGLSVVVPHGDNNYYDPTKRPDLAVQPPDANVPQAEKAHDLDGFFGLSDPWAPLLTAYIAQDLFLSHATGSLSTSRSHFDARRFMELGKEDTNLSTGWLSRHLATMPPLCNDAILRAVSVNTGLAQTLAPPIKSIPVPNLTNFGLDGQGSTETARLNALEAMYQCDIDPLPAVAATTKQTIGLLESIDFNNYCNGGAGANYDPTGNNNPFARSLRSIAGLIAADVGVEAAHYEYGGWDTHQAQDNLNPGGYLYLRMRDVANALSAFYEDMCNCNMLDRVTLVLVSEFGRTFDQNGNLGTDHGAGNFMLAMGKNINGGQVLTASPGGAWTSGNSYLDASQLDTSGDLRTYLDYRDILREVLEERIQHPDVAQVFEAVDPTYVPVNYNVTM